MLKFRLLFGSALFLSSAAVAQEEIIVTASRIDQPGYSVGGSYSIITEKDLAQRQTRFVSDALRAVPGVAVNRSGAVGSYTQLRIRGAEASQTLVLVDGVKANAPGDFANQFDFGNLLAIDIDRIEVLRGAQSSIWGSNAIGGVINIVSREPSHGFSGLAAFEGGSYDTTNYHARLAYGGQRFSVSLGGSAFFTHGISTADSRYGARERDQNRNDTADGRIKITPVDNLTITLTGRYINSELGTDATPPFDSDDIQHLNQRWGNAQVKWSAFNGRLENIAASSVLDIKSNTAGSDSGIFSNRGSKEIYSDQINLYGATTLIAPARHRLTALFEFERDAGSSTFFSPFFSSTNPNRVTENRGLAAEYGLEIADQLFFTASLRHDDNSRFADTTTYRATAAYRILTTRTRFHGSYGTGVENPTFSELFGSGVNFVGNPLLQPETSRSVDFGVEQTFFANKAKLDVTLFENRIDSRITGFGTTAINTPGRTKIRGIELMASVALAPHLQADFSYTAMNSQSPEGAELTRRPRHAGSLALNYEVQQWRANFNLGVTYNGRSRDQDFCVPTGGFCSFASPAPYVNLRGYALVTLAAAYEILPGIQLNARIENGLDQHYEEVIYYGAPRLSAFGGLTYKFGS